VFESFQEFFILGRRHQRVEVGLVLELEADDPALAVGILIDKLGGTIQAGIDLNDFAADWRNTSETALTDSIDPIVWWISSWLPTAGSSI
jgi:hypothetical protein